MLEINADPLAPAVIQLFSKSESNNINRLVLISFRLARARAGTDRFSRGRISVALAAFAGLPRVTLEDHASAARASDAARDGFRRSTPSRKGAPMRNVRHLRPTLRCSCQNPPRGEDTSAVTERARTGRIGQYCRSPSTAPETRGQNWPNGIPNISGRGYPRRDARTPVRSASRLPPISIACPRPTRRRSGG